MQAISTRLFSRALYWKRYTRRMRSGDETNPWFVYDDKILNQQILHACSGSSPMINHLTS